MNFTNAVMICLKNKYVDFQGRASRSEYWYWALFYSLVNLVASGIGAFIFSETISALSYIAMLALALPSLGVAVRRLHDGNHCGWWILLSAIPLFGILVLLYWFVQKGTTGSNQYGPDSLA